MSVKLSPPPRQQYLDANGNPYSGAKLFTYAAGSSTKQATYTDNTGETANSNPIILDASGRTPYGIWLTSGLYYKFILAPSTDTDPPTSAIFTEDVVTGVNDTTTPAALSTSAQWVASGLTPTYVSGTQFTLVGDQTANFHVGRRLRFTVTAGTVYGEISVSAFTTLTTVTVVLDSGALDSGLSAVDVGILTAVNSAIPKALTLGAQPLDPLLTALAAQTTAANQVQTYSGADTASLTNIGAAAGDMPLWDYIPLNSISSQAAAYTVLAADRGKLIDATTGTWALSFDPTTATGLGANFAFAVRNSGTGIITLTPTSGTLDGAATVALGTGESCFVMCDGTNAKIVGRSQYTSAFSAYQSTGQSISASTTTTVLFQTKDFDNLSEYNATTGVFTASESGVYEFGVQVIGTQDSAAATWNLSLSKNGSTTYLIDYNGREVSGINGIWTRKGSRILKLSAGDTVSTLFTVSVADTLNNTADNTYFWGKRVG
ncbi:MAG: C1q-like domain-containing protein [Burkholderiales bacterium]